MKPEERPPAVVVQAGDLRQFIRDVLVAAGVPPDKAQLVADPLVASSLRGVDSHGVQLLPHYLGQIERGEVNPLTEGRVLSENGACLVYDAEHGLGQVTAPVCCRHAVRLALQYGLSMVVAREANHFGAAAYWGQAISREGLIGIVMCDASMQVPPWQGREARLGTNPICVSVPHPEGEGWLLDMATTTAAYGKLEQALLRGEKTIPYGWAVDREGVPTTDLEEALKGLLMPLGGYKGTGLAMMVEILTGVLAGGPVYGTQVTGVRHRGRPMRCNHTFMAIDVRRFLPLEQFYQRMEAWIRDVKSAAPAKGYHEVLVAGDPERRFEERRRREGIPIVAGHWEPLVRLARRYGVPLPPSRTVA
ncbi:MAG: Ldh family oxidoreductase [Bryobacterales bacterium]|nr:Ldh family oxidoreductase [Bryobacteraceae bacterium]MDW8129994.1 Ldh family oxidoreductase [Bryobacterales bacterium]